MRLAVAAVVWMCGCGRVGFTALADSNGRDTAAATPPSWVQNFVERGFFANATTDTFTAAAAHVGDAIVLHTMCEVASPATVSLTAPGWTIEVIGPPYETSPAMYWAASFAAIAPTTAATTFTVQWNTTGTCSFVTELGDEFAGAEPTGGAVTFDGHSETTGSGDCVATVRTGHADDAVWAACNVNNADGVGSGYTKAGDDGAGDWSEWKQTEDPANTAEAISFETTTGSSWYLISAITIAPR